MRKHDEEIKKIENSLKLGITDKFQKFEVLNLLRKYKYDNVEEKDRNDIEKNKELDEIAREVIVLGTELIYEGHKNQFLILKTIRSCYEFRARRNFRDFLISAEWDFSDDQKFYKPRRMVFDEWIKYLESLEKGDLKGLGISAPPRTGKALSNDSKVLTDEGWKRIGDVQVGDMIFGDDGKLTEVLGVFPQGKRPIYRLTLDDNTEIDCSDDHLWNVRSSFQTKRCVVDGKRVVKSECTFRTLTTNQIIKNLGRSNGKGDLKPRYAIELVKPVEFSKKTEEGDIPPYYLGTLLGNMYNKNKEKLLEVGADKFTPEEIYKKYKELGILKENPNIPRKYLYSDVEDRKELLAGILDSDGFTSKSDFIEYIAINKRMAEDVAELIRSLGGKVTINKKIGDFRLNSIGYWSPRKTSGIVYVLRIKIVENPFLLEEKRNIFDDRYRLYDQRKHIMEYKILPEQECTCIFVNNPSHLFITDNYTVTHNTGVGTFFFMWCMLRHPDKSCLFVSHTNAMAKKVYTDILNYLTDSRRNISKVFPEFAIVEKNAEDLFIQLKHNGSNNYKTAYFRGIDGNMAGILEASWLLYCDDLIKNIEEAKNPDRLQNAREKYSTDILQRKKNKNVKELHIATRWSLHDVISTLEAMHDEDEKWKFIRRPAINENGESNFMYDGENAMDMEHWNNQRNSPDMDEVSFNCIYQQEPIERDGLLINEEELLYYNGELPGVEPDLVCFATDVAWGGGDYLSMPIAYVYGLDVYIHDLVYNNKTKQVTKPLVKSRIMVNNAKQGYFEANNGGDEYADSITDSLKADNYRCAISSSKAPTNKSKLARILSCVDEIKGQGTGYKLYFLDKQARKRVPGYDLFMKHIFMFNQGLKFQGKQKDDGLDSLSMLLTNVLGSKVVRTQAKSTNFSKKDLGF